MSLRRSLEAEPKREEREEMEMDQREELVELEIADERRRRRDIELSMTPWHKDVTEIARLWRWLELMDELPRDPALFIETALSWSAEYDRMNEVVGR